MFTSGLKKIFISAFFLILISSSSFSSTRTVTNCADIGDANYGPGSLRWEIVSAEAGDLIAFNITTLESGYSTGEGFSGAVTNEAAGASWFRIALKSSTRFDITGSGKNNLIIDGSTQPNTGEISNPYGPTIEVSGSRVGFGVNCLSIYLYDVSGVVIKGLAFDYSQLILYSISSAASNCRMQENYFGCTATGEGTKNLFYNAIDVSGEGNVIGSTEAGKGNVISGMLYGIKIMEGAVNTGIYGNKIGTNKLGTAALPNQTGIYFDVGDISGTKIGGSSAAERNIISGNSGDGIQFSGNSKGQSNTVINTIEGNYIGINAAGNQAIANAYGIGINGDRKNIHILGNIISGNTNDGIELNRSFAGNITSVEVYGNIFGLGADRSAIPNGRDGIRLTSYAIGWKIGRSSSPSYSYAGNTIESNAGNGIYIHDYSTDNTIEANTIANNGDCGIRFATNQAGINVLRNNILPDITDSNHVKPCFYNNASGAIVIPVNQNSSIRPPTVLSASLTKETTDSLYVIGTVESGALTGEVFLYVATIEGTTVEGKYYIGKVTSIASLDSKSTFYGSIAGLPTSLISQGDKITALFTDSSRNSSWFSGSATVGAVDFQGSLKLSTLESRQALTSNASIDLSNANTGKLYLRVLNSGAGTDIFTVSAEAADDASIRVKYYDGTTDITSKMTTEGYPLLINPGSSNETLSLMVISQGGALNKSFNLYMRSLDPSVTSKNTVSVIATNEYQPDLMIASSSKVYIGEGIYNETAVNQTKTISSNLGETTEVYFKLDNAGNITDGYLLTAEGNNSSWTIKCYKGSDEITSQILSAYYVPSQETSVPQEYRLDVTYNGTTNASREIWIKSSSTNEGTKRDYVKAIVCYSQNSYTTKEIDMPALGIIITVPQGAQTQEVFISATEQGTLALPPSGFIVAGKGIEFTSNFSQFLLPITVTLSIESGTIDPKIYYWDGSKWSSSGITIISYTDTTITFTTTHMSIFAPFGAALGNYYRFGPNPFNPNNGTGRFWYWLTQAKDTSIYLFNAEGVLEWRQSYSAGTNGGNIGENNIEFDGKNASGDILGTGVYLYRIVQGTSSLGGGKIAVIK